MEVSPGNAFGTTSSHLPLRSTLQSPVIEVMDEFDLHDLLKFL